MQMFESISEKGAMLEHLDWENGSENDWLLLGSGLTGIHFFREGFRASSLFVRVV
jgi:hypothetical protein